MAEVFKWRMVIYNAESSAETYDVLYKTGVKTEHSGYTQLYIHVWFSLRS